LSTPIHKFERWGALPVHRSHCMIATADAWATSAGVEVLREGGNAVDAAICAAFVLCVTQPGMCGLGGGGHFVARFADGTSLCLDFRERAPLHASSDVFANRPAAASLRGRMAAATPGTVRGLGDAHAARGSIVWRRLVEPAMAIAAQGYELSYLRSKMAAGCAAIYEDPESSRTYRLKPGEVMRMPDLAATLRRIADQGPDEFYHGQTARRLAGEWITAEDLASYTSAKCEPLIGSFRGREIWTMPPSSAGGIGLLQTLAILDGTPFAEDGPGSSQFFHYVAEALRRSFADRASCIGDPAFERVPPHLLDPEHIECLRRSIDPERATPSAGVASSGEAACTTHISVLDAQGNAVALTFTLNGIYGSGVTAPGLGFLLNNNMDNFSARPGTPNQYGMMQTKVNAIAPGKRPVSSMAPAIVCNANGVEIVMGTPGGPTIVSATVQSLLHLLDFGWNARDAAEVRRIHHQWMPDTLFHEVGIASDVLRGLERRGHTLRLKTPLTDMNIIVRRDEWIEGGVDSRRESVADGF
jgi:gamma-glutamyltranspeptidase/glutathione hydrolase